MTFAEFLIVVIAVSLFTSCVIGAFVYWLFYREGERHE